MESVAAIFWFAVVGGTRGGDYRGWQIWVRVSGL